MFSILDTLNNFKDIKAYTDVIFDLTKTIEVTRR